MSSISVKTPYYSPSVRLSLSAGAAAWSCTAGRAGGERATAAGGGPAHTTSVCELTSLAPLPLLMCVQRSVSELEAALADRERECLRLQSAVPPPMVDASLQTSPPPSRPEPRPSEPRPHTTDTNPGARKSSRERVKSPVHRDVARLRKSSGSPRVELEAGGTGLGSLEHEMRAAGVEVTDSFDSSEGVGFSESVVEEGASTHSLESFVSREEEGTLLQLGEGPSGRPALQTKSSWTEAKTESEGSGAMATPLNFPLAVTHTGSDETVKEVDHVTSHDAQPPQSTPPPLDYAEVINPAESGDSSASDPPTLPNNGT